MNDILEMAQGNLTRVIAVRLRPGTDVLAGLTEACRRANINNGVILSAIGSLDGVAYCNPVELPDKKAGYGYGEVLHLTGPIELTVGSGIICHDDQGQHEPACSHEPQRSVRQRPRRTSGGGHKGVADCGRSHRRDRRSGHGKKI